MLERVLPVLAGAAILPAQALLLPAIPLPTNAAPNAGVHAGDYDLDGDVDITVGGDLFRNDGYGGYAVSLVRSPVAGPTGIVAGPVAAVDIDQDGDTDFVYFDGLWIDNGGGFTDETATRIGATFSVGAHIQLVYDVDGDGDFDLLAVFVNVVSGGYRLLYLETALNDGTGNFPTGSSRYLGGGSSVLLQGLVSGDFDGNGTADLAFSFAWSDIGGSSGQFGGVFPDSGSAVLPGSTGLTARQLRAVADFDGDGRDDIIATGGSGTTLHRGGVNVSPVSSATGGSYAIDFDGDGDVDCVSRTSGGSFQLALNDGTGTFTIGGLPIAAAPIYDEQFAFADLDRDGDADVVAAGPPRVFANARQQLSAPTTIGLSTTLTFAVDAVAQAGPLTGAFVVGLSLQPADVPLGALGTLLLDPLGIALLPPSMLAAGAGATSFAIPGVPAIIGLQLHAQALIDDSAGRLHLSNRTRTTIQ